MCLSEVRRRVSYLAFARDFEDLGAVGFYNPLQAENKLSNPYYLTPFLIMCLIDSVYCERGSTLLKKVINKKRRNSDV